jgi:hypothetical protein
MKLDARLTKQGYLRAVTLTLRIECRLRISETMAAIASPDHSRWPPRYLSAARTLQPTSAAIFAAVFVGQSVDAMSERTEPTKWSEILMFRPTGRTVSVAHSRAAPDTDSMNKRPCTHTKLNWKKDEQADRRLFHRYKILMGARLKSMADPLTVRREIVHVTMRRKLCSLHDIRTLRGVAHGECLSVSASAAGPGCYGLLESKNCAVDWPLTKGLQSVTDQHKILGGDFLAGPPVDHCGGPHGRHDGCFGWASQRFDHGFD